MNSSLDALWVIISASLVFLMQAGFLCLEAGSTRRKNNVNVAIKNIADLGLSVLIFWVLGYGLMFGSSIHGWLGSNQFAPELGQTQNWSVILFLFHAMFCSTAVTILSGAVAERMNFKGYLLVAILISGLIYPIFGHWAWNDSTNSVAIGWLAQKGFVDFAGASVVHSVGGWASLAVILIIGPRIGRFSTKRSHQHLPSSDIPLAFLGTLILWFGWFGFNAGSTLAFDSRVPGILTNTLLAGAAGIVAPLGWLLFRQRQVSVGLVMNGALAGLVSITASCHAVSSYQALLIGGIGGLVMMGTTTALYHWKIDDAVGAIPVHLGGGLWGTIAVALFGYLPQLGTGLDRLAQLQAQLSGILACGIWTFSGTLLILLFVNQWVTLRVSKRQEYMGLNIAEHGVHGEFQALYNTMSQHARTGNLKHRVMVDSFTEVGQISRWYNQVIQSLEQMVARIDGIVTTAVDSIMTVDPETLVIQSTNPATEDLFGYPWLQLVGETLTVCISVDLHASSENALPKLSQLLQEGCRTGTVLEGFGFDDKRRLFPVEITVATSRVGNEKFWTVMVRDISDRKAAEAALQKSELAARNQAEQLQAALVQLKQTQAQLIQGEKMASLGCLVAGVAHEINNPVNFIHGNLRHAQDYVENLQEAIAHYQEACPSVQPEIQEKINHLELDFLRDDFPKMLFSMQQGTERIRDIVRSLRTFSRHDEASFKEVNIHEGLDSALQLLVGQLRATSKRSEIIISKQYGNLPTVECYASAINQVFFYILSNAIEALNHDSMHQHQGEISIKTEVSQNQISIAISNNGPGIPNNIQSKIFEPFFTTKDVGEGIGMGLAISHQIVVDQHDGQLICQSLGDQGTSFVIILPQA